MRYFNIAVPCNFVFFSFNNGFGFKDSTGVSVYDNHPDKVIIEEPRPDAGRGENRIFCLSGD
jgi:hypothetical protein